MNYSRTLVVTAICAVLLPGIFVAATSHSSVATLSEDAVLILENWAFMVLPQLVVVALAGMFPALRRQFAVRALLAVSVLVAAFLFLTSRDPNGPMLWVFYLPLSAVLLLVIGLFPIKRANVRRL